MFQAVLHSQQKNKVTSNTLLLYIRIDQMWFLNVIYNKPELRSMINLHVEERFISCFSSFTDQQKEKYSTTQSIVQVLRNAD